MTSNRSTRHGACGARAQQPVGREPASGTGTRTCYAPAAALVAPLAPVLPPYTRAARLCPRASGNDRPFAAERRMVLLGGAGDRNGS
jgi:hypothetical protein